MFGKSLRYFTSKGARAEGGVMNRILLQRFRWVCLAAVALTCGCAEGGDIDVAPPPSFTPATAAPPEVATMATLPSELEGTWAVIFGTDGTYTFGESWTFTGGDYAYSFSGCRTGAAAGNCVTEVERGALSVSDDTLSFRIGEWTCPSQSLGYSLGYTATATTLTLKYNDSDVLLSRASGDSADPLRGGAPSALGCFDGSTFAAAELRVAVAGQTSPAAQPSTTPPPTSTGTPPPAQVPRTCSQVLEEPDAACVSNAEAECAWQMAMARSTRGGAGAVNAALVQAQMHPACLGAGAYFCPPIARVRTYEC